MRTIIAALSDTHAGSPYGLCNPEAEIEADAPGNIAPGPPQLTAVQKYLWHEVYIPAVEELLAFAGNDPLIVIHNGDLTDGNKYANGSVSEQVQIGCANLMPLLAYKRVTHLRLMRGTTAHSFGEGDAESLAQAILSARYPKIDVKTAYHGELEINGAILDISHHGPGRGIRVWLAGNQFRYYMRDILMRYAMRGAQMPDVILRSHTHGRLLEWIELNGHSCWGVITPPLQMTTAFARQAMRSPDEIELGLAAVEVFERSGRRTISVHWFTRRLDIRTREKIL